MQAILPLIGIFIAASIMIGIGTVILGGSVTDCTSISDYVAANDDAGATADHNQTGWSAECFESQDSSQGGYGLIGITLIVLGAVIVLAVVRMLA